MGTHNAPPGADGGKGAGRRHGIIRHGFFFSSRIRAAAPHHLFFLFPQFFIVADSTFNPAALDEVTAIDHGRAHVAVHYGPASLAAPARLPCRFVFGRRGGLSARG